MLMRECLIDEIQPFMKEYLGELSSPFDSFLEKRILASAFYVVLDGLQVVGYYAIHRGQLLTQFYLRRSAQRYAQDVFTQVLERHFVTSLFVPTCDELFLSLAIDKDFPLKKQAYFFQDSRTDSEHAEALNAVLANDLHLSMVEIDEFWSFVRKKTAAMSQPTRENAGDVWCKTDPRASLPPVPPGASATNWSPEP